MIRHCPSRPLTVAVAGEEDEMVGPLAVVDVDVLRWRMKPGVEEEEEE